LKPAIRGRGARIRAGRRDRRCDQDRRTGFRLWSGTAQAATYVGKSTILYAGTNLSPALLGVGYIVG